MAMKCPKCGVDVRNDFGYCMNCGESLPVESPSSRKRGWIGKVVGLTIAVIGIFFLVGGIVLCFMSAQEAYNYYGMPIYHTTYPYRDEGLGLVAIGSIAGIAGFIGFFVSRYRNS
jgi:uncharacterized membrane protein